MKLNRFKINQMVDRGDVNIGGRRTGGSGGAGGGGGVSSTWVDENYVSKEFFARLFTINGVDEDDNDVVVEPNDMDTDITNIQAMVGLWTEEYLSALGLGSGGGGGGASLTEPLASINESGIGLPLSSNQVIVWNGSAWTYRPYTTGSGTVTSIKITVPTGFTVNPSQAITTAGTFVIGFDTGYSLPTNTKQGQWDDAYSWVNTNAASTVSKTAWGRTYWNAGVPQNISGDIENAADIYIDNGKRIYWKKSDASGYLSILTFDGSDNFVIGESMASSGLTTYLRGRSITFQTGTGTSGNHSASLSSGGVLTVEKLVIGGITISHDTTNGGLHVESAGLYADTYLSALGAGSGGGGGASLTEPLASINTSGIGLPLAANKVIIWTGSGWDYAPYSAATGTVTSVAMTVPTGFKVSNGNAQTISSAGTFALTFDTGYSLPTNTKQDQWDDAYTWVSTNGVSTASFTAWGRTYWSQGAPQSIDGDIQNAAHIKIDNAKSIYWKRANSSSYLSLITLDGSDNFVIGESMASSGLTTYLRGRTITFQSGSGTSGNHTASIDNTGLFTVEKLKIGNIVISEDTTNGGLHVESAGIYADTYVSALGAGSGGGGGSTGITIEDVWTAMAATAPNSSSQQINVSHMAQALSNYATNSSVNSAIATAVSGVTKWLTIRNGDGTTIYGTYNGTSAVTIDIPSGGSYTLPAATSGALGGIKIGYTESGNDYAVKLSSEKAYVTVPWTDTTNTAGNETKDATLLYLVGSTAKSTTSGSSNKTNVSSKCYIGSDNCLYSNTAKVATETWVGNQGYLTSVSAASSSAIGGIKIGYTSSGKNYAVQLSSDKAYVNVPWTDHYDWNDITSKPNVMTTDTAQNVSGVKTFTANIAMSADITPYVNNQQYIGTSSKKFLGAYIGAAVISNTGVTVGGTVTAGSCIEIGGTETLSNVSCATVKTLSSKGIYIKTGTSPNWIDGTWNNTSDIRLKDIIEDAVANIEDIAKAPVFYFKWKAGGKDVMLGTSAQAWEKIFPPAVKDAPNGYLSMDYNGTAIAAVVITARKVVNHEHEIARLKKRIEELEKQLAS